MKTIRSILVAIISIAFIFYFRYSQTDEARVERFANNSRDSIAEKMKPYLDDTVELEISAQNKSLIIAYRYKKAEDVVSSRTAHDLLRAQKSTAQSILDDLKRSGIKSPVVSVRYLHPTGEFIMAQKLK